MLNEGVALTKKCVLCGKDQEYAAYHKDRRKGDGYAARCKICVALGRAERHRRYKERLRLGQVRPINNGRASLLAGHKICPGCHEDKLLEAFTVRNKAVDGRETYCRACHSARYHSTPRTRARNRRGHQRQREKTIAGMGGSCVRCGFDDLRALQIDHVAGGGVKDRATRGNYSRFLKDALQSFVRGENKYQILCANCNWIKKAENREVPNAID